MRTNAFSRAGLAVLALCVMALSSARAQQTLYLAAFGSPADELYTVDPATGQTNTDIGPVTDGSGNPVNLFALCFQPGTGILFAVTSPDSPTASISLVTVDTNAAVVTDIGPLGFIVNDIAFDPVSGGLYGTDTAGNLCTIDPTTGQATVIGDAGFGSVNSGGFAINYLGQYFTVQGSAGDVLSVYDPTTGAASTVANLSGAPYAGGEIYNLAVDANNILYGVNTDNGGPSLELVIIDPSSGQITDLGPTAGNDGLAFSLPTVLPAAPLVATLAATSVTTTTATLNGLVNPEGLDTAVFIEWGTNSTFGNTNDLGVVSASFTPQSVSSPLTGLLPGTTYYFSVVATNESGSVPGEVLSFTTASTPAVATLAATAVTATRATLNGLVDPDGLDTAVFVEWGTNSTFGNTNELADVSASFVPQGVSLPLTGLLPSTTYFFEVVATNESGSAPGGILSFTTPSASGSGSQPALYSAGYTGGGPDELYTLSPTNGAVIADIGPLVDTGGNFYTFYALRFQPATGTLYGIANQKLLVTVDPVTAVVTVVGSLNLSGGIADIAFDPVSGTLYGTDNRADLCVINLTTGRATPLSPSSFDYNGDYGAGFAINAFGRGYTTPFDGNTFASLILGTYTLATGAGTTLVNLGGGLFGFQNDEIYNLAFDSSGTLFGVDFPDFGGGQQHLITINPVTGQITDLGVTIAGDGLAFTPPAPPPAAPLVETLAVGVVTDATAMINGAVIPDGLDTAVFIEWGTTTNFGNTNELAGLAAGVTPQNVSSGLSGLLPGTEYFFVIAATNSTGIATGDVLHFTTLPPLSPGFDQWLYSTEYGVGTNGSDELFILNPANGQPVLDIGPTLDANGNVYNLGSLRFQPGTGALYGIGILGGVEDFLVTIDRATAMVTSIGFLNDNLTDIAFDPVSGGLYGTSVNQALYLIDPATAQEIYLGNTGLPSGNVEGFAINPLEQYFTTPDGDGGMLATLNPATGAGTMVAQLCGSPYGNGYINNLAFTANNTLYGLDTSSDYSASHLVTVNTNTGRITDLGCVPVSDSLAFSLPLTAPSVTTLEAISVNTNSATLDGWVNPNGEATTVSILWGTTTNFGNTNEVASLPAGYSPQYVSNAVTGLSCLTKYYYTVVATNSLGCARGRVLSFRTPPPAFKQLLFTAVFNPAGADELYTLNPANGQLVTDIGPLVDAAENPYFCTALRFQPVTGTLYGLLVDSTSTEFLVTINPATALVTVVGNLNASYPPVRDMAFDPATGMLYGTDGAANLETIDLPSGQANPVSESIFSVAGDSGGGLAINAFGQAFTTPFSANGALGTYNLATGAGTQVAMLNGGTFGSQPNFIENAAFDRNNTMYGVDYPLFSGGQHLVAIDTGTGLVTDVGATTGGYGLAFSLPLPLAPYVTTVAASALTCTTATLNGLVNPEGISTAVTILWGTTPEFGNTNELADLPAGIAPECVSLALTNLTPLTTYYFTVAATNAFGPRCGQTLSFITPIPPTIGAGAVGGVGPNSVTLSASVNPGDGQTTVYFEWGVTTAYGNTNEVVVAGTLGAEPVNGVINGLLPGTTYHFSIVVVNSAGSASVTDMTFTTATLPPITVMNFYHLGDNDPGAASGGMITSTVDSIGGNNLSGTNSPVYTNQVPALATNETGSQFSVDFNGVNQSLGGPGLAPVVDNFGLEAWVNPAGADSGGGNQVIVYNGDTGANGWGLFEDNGGNLLVLYGGGRLFGDTGVPLAAGMWTHLALVRDNGITTLYTNGVAVATFSNTPRQPSAVFALGADPQNGTDEAFYGLIDEVRFFTFAPGQFYTNDLLINAAGPTLLAQSIASLTTNSAGLEVTLNPNGSAGTVTFLWGETASFGNTNVVAYDAGTSPITVSDPLTGLSPLTTYYVSVTATNASGTESAQVFQFTVPPPPPAVVTLAASGVTGQAAALHGTVDPMGAATTASFAWGTTPSLGNTNAVTVVAGGFGASDVDYTLTGLASVTTYYYAAVASNAGGMVTGGILSFTTATAPVAVTAPATAVAGTTAILGGEVDAKGLMTAVSFAWGTTPSLGQTFSAGYLPAGYGLPPVSGTLTGLAPGTRYYYAVVASNPNGVVMGRVLSFTTATAPVAVTGAASGVTATTVLLNGGVDPKGLATAVSFAWGTTPSLGQTSPAGTLAAGYGLPAVSGTLTGLTPATTYYYAVVASNLGGVVTGNVLSFSTETAIPPVAVTAPATAVTGTTATLNGGVDAKGLITAISFAWGPTSSLGQTYSAGYLAAGYGLPPVSGPLTGLTPATRYYYAVVASNVGGVVTGNVLSFTTLTLPVVHTLAAGAVTETSAMLNGIVDPKGLATAASFAWGATTGLGTTNLAASLPAEYASPGVSDALTGLAPGTKYYYAVVATSVAGTVTGPVLSFTTAGGDNVRAPGKPDGVSMLITGVFDLANGTKRIELAGTPGQTYVIEASNEAGTGSWSVISTNTAAANGRFSLVDPQSARAPRRFYRLRSP